MNVSEYINLVWIKTFLGRIIRFFPSGGWFKKPFTYLGTREVKLIHDPSANLMVDELKTETYPLIKVFKERCVVF